MLWYKAIKTNATFHNLYSLIEFVSKKVGTKFILNVFNFYKQIKKIESLLSSNSLIAL